MVAHWAGKPLGTMGRRDLRSSVLAFTSRVARDETLSRLSKPPWTLDRPLDRQPCHGALLRLVSHQQRRTVRRSRTLDRRAENSANCPAGGPGVRLDLHPPGP